MQNSKNGDSKRILVLGTEGQVGRAFKKLILEDPGQYIGLFASRREVDLSNAEGARKAIQEFSPHVIINAAAYTQVDRAEEEKELARRINTDTVGVIARWCAEKNIPFIHFSTDYVFPGTGQSPWVETGKTAPINYYGLTKRDGENQVLESACPALIFRTSWVYDETGKNFLNTMIRLGQEREELRIVDDQVGAPTYALDLAQAVWNILPKIFSDTRNRSLPWGVYHACGQGETSWFRFAQAIFEKAHQNGIPLRVKNLVPIATSDFPTPAKRPLNSRLSQSKLKQNWAQELPHWEDALTRCFKNKLQN